MPVVSSNKVIELSRAADPKEALLKAVGDLSKESIPFNHLLVATYISPEKTPGGIILTARSKDEDVYQGKVGLVVKKGHFAFKSDQDFDFDGINVDVGQWVAYRVGDGFACRINGVDCRMIQDRSVKMILSKPDVVF